MNHDKKFHLNEIYKKPHCAWIATAMLINVYEPEVANDIILELIKNEKDTNIY